MLINLSLWANQLISNLNMSYWDINDFLAQEEQIQFSFKQDSPGMGFVDPSKDLTEVVPAMQPLSAPIWLVETMYNYLVINQSQMIKIQMPKYLYYEDFLHMMNQVQQDSRMTPQAANLRKKSIYLYQIYPYLIKIISGEKSKVSVQKICNFLNKRGNAIVSRIAAHTGNEKIEHLLCKWTQFETEIYKRTNKQTIQHNQWKYKIQNISHR